MTRPPMTLSAQPREYRHTPGDLLRALRLMRERARRSALPRAENFSDIAGHVPVPVEEKIAAVLSQLLRRGRLPLRDIYQTATSRSELVALFLAVLDIVNGQSAELPEDTLILSKNGIS